MTPTTYFPYRQGQLCCELLPLTKLADAVGTPAYVYSKAALLASYAAYDHAFKDVPHLICYSIKANSNLGVISTLAKVGAGADIVSGGELHRALRAGVAPKKIIFSGVGKTRDEMRDALKAEILLFNVESVGELREPGRSIVGNAGALLTRVLYHKPTDAKTFVVVDAAMNDLVRPAFYASYHAILPVAEAPAGAPVETADVVGPICESGDFFAKDRALPRPEEGDLLAILSAGAYGFAMASNYNTRPRPGEVLVDGDRYTIVRRREP